MNRRIARDTATLIRRRDIDHLRIVDERQAGPGLVQDGGQDDHLLLSALEPVDGVGFELVERVPGLVGLEAVRRGDADVVVGEAWQWSGITSWAMTSTSRWFEHPPPWCWRM
jgi:hypothetical protein